MKKFKILLILILVSIAGFQTCASWNSSGDDFGPLFTVGGHKTSVRQHAQNLLREMLLRRLSVFFHEVGHSATYWFFTGKFMDITIGHSSDELSPLCKKTPRAHQGPFIKFNSPACFSGYAEQMKKTQHQSQQKTLENHENIIEKLAGPALGACADFTMALIIEIFNQRKVKISLKTLLKKALDRAALSMINQLANLIIPTPGSDGKQIFDLFAPNDKTQKMVTQIILAVIGTYCIDKLQSKVSYESLKRKNDYFMKPESLLFAAGELYRRKPKETLCGLLDTPRLSTNMVSTWLPEKLAKYGNLLSMAMPALQICYGEQIKQYVKSH
ncbi:hypothetical protein ACFLY6_03450 [Candidatus Dependentiae bacterium]